MTSSNSHNRVSLNQSQNDYDGTLDLGSKHSFTSSSHHRNQIGISNWNQNNISSVLNKQHNSSMQSSSFLEDSAIGSRQTISANSHKRHQQVKSFDASAHYTAQQQQQICFSKLDTFGESQKESHGNKPSAVVNHNNLDRSAATTVVAQPAIKILDDQSQHDILVKTLMQEITRAFGIAIEPSSNYQNSHQHTYNSNTSVDRVTPLNTNTSYNIDEFKPQHSFLKVRSSNNNALHNTSTAETGMLQDTSYNIENYLPSRPILTLAPKPKQVQYINSDTNSSQVSDLLLQLLQEIKGKKDSLHQSQTVDSQQNKRARLSVVHLPSMNLQLRNPLKIVKDIDCQTNESAEQQEIHSSQRRPVPFQFSAQQVDMMMNAKSKQITQQSSRRSSVQNLGTLEQHSGYHFEMESEVVASDFMPPSRNNPAENLIGYENISEPLYYPTEQKMQLLSSSQQQQQQHQSQLVHPKPPAVPVATKQYHQIEALQQQRLRLHELELKQKQLDEEFEQEEQTRNQLAKSNGGQQNNNNNNNSNNGSFAIEDSIDFETIRRLERIPFPQISLSRKDSLVTNSNILENTTNQKNNQSAHFYDHTNPCNSLQQSQASSQHLINSWNGMQQIQQQQQQSQMTVGLNSIYGGDKSGGNNRQSQEQDVLWENEDPIELESRNDKVKTEDKMSKAGSNGNQRSESKALPDETDEEYWQNIHRKVTLIQSFFRYCWTYENQRLEEALSACRVYPYQDDGDNNQQINNQSNANMTSQQQTLDKHSALLNWHDQQIQQSSELVVDSIRSHHHHHHHNRSNQRAQSPPLPTISHQYFADSKISYDLTTSPTSDQRVSLQFSKRYSATSNNPQIPTTYRSNQGRVSRDFPQSTQRSQNTLNQPSQSDYPESELKLNKAQQQEELPMQNQTLQVSSNQQYFSNPSFKKQNQLNTALLPEIARLSQGSDKSSQDKYKLGTNSSSFGISNRSASTYSSTASMPLIHIRDLQQVLDFAFSQVR